MSLFSPPPDCNRNMYLFLFLLTLGTTLGFQGWSLLFTNFAVQEAHLSAAQNGLIHSFREVPGLLGIVAIPLLCLLREHRLAAFAAIATGLGTLATGFAPSFRGIVATVMLMSFGFHIFETLSQSLMIQYYDIRKTPLVMGRMRGLAAGGSLAVSVFVFLCAPLFSFPVLFGVVGGAGMALGLCGLFLDPSDAALPRQNRGMVLRGRYWLFYLLTLLAGARRLIFTVFALFLLVQKFGFSVRTVAILFMVNYAVNWFLNPLIGQVINRFGERRLLSVEYASAIGIFLGYAWTDSPYLAAALYIVDSVTFNFAIALRTFFQKIAAPADVAPSMAVAQTINHLSAVCVPAFGGWLWVTFGAPAPFYLGVGVAAVSLICAQRIDRELARHGR